MLSWPEWIPVGNKQGAQAFCHGGNVYSRCNVHLERQGMMNCRRISLCLLALSVLAVVSSQVSAAPAYKGYTGLMLTPTAETLKTGSLNFGAVFLNNDNNDTSFVSANIGLLDSLEVGDALISPEVGDSEGIINAKFSLLKETIATPALAIGLSDMTDQFDATPYIVATKALQIAGKDLWAPKIHLGVGSGSLDGVFAGLSATVSDRTQLMVEYDTDDVNFGLQFSAANNLRLHAGLIGGDNFGFGMSYNAGF